MDNLIASARANKGAITFAKHDASQFNLQYGREQAEVIMNISGNIISD